MKPSLVIAMVLLCSVASGCFPIGGSEDACVAARPDAEPSQAAPGESFRLHGEGFRDGCNDTGPPFLPEPPQRDIRIEMRQGERTWRLAVVDADPDYTLGTELEVPADAGPGQAVVVIRAGDEEPTQVPFRVLGGES